jgi:hypothetical protein
MGGADAVINRKIPRLPAWVRCGTCGHWRRLEASRLGVSHPGTSRGCRLPVKASPRDSFGTRNHRQGCRDFGSGPV